MSIEAVVFDWGGVLAGNLSAGFAEMEQGLGVPPGSMPELLGMHPCATDSTNLWHQRDLGRASATEWAEWFARRVLDAGGPALPVDMLVASESERFASIDPNPVMIETVRRLSDAGYLLGICTNNFVEVGAAWREQLPMDLFDAVAVSCELGVRKPDAAMYAAVTGRLGSDPAKTVLLDDFAPNVEGARNAGWQAIHVVDHHAAVAELESLLG